jgi:hypothetical protein
VKSGLQGLQGYEPGEDEHEGDAESEDVLHRFALCHVAHLQRYKVSLKVVVKHKNVERRSYSLFP